MNILIFSFPEIKESNAFFFTLVEIREKIESIRRIKNYIMDLKFFELNFFFLMKIGIHFYLSIENYIAL